MTSPVLTKLIHRWPIDRWRGLTVIVACSGGADSTALLRALATLQPDDTTLIVAHYNHRLRDAESDGDEEFVAKLSQSLGLLFVSNHDRDPIQGGAGTSEADLRGVRYAFLAQVARQQGARYVALAHTADDSVETVLHHLARGTGLAGLTGVRAFRDFESELVLMRPMIDVWRTEVIEFLEQLSQSFRTDSSNTSLDYTRNVIRHRWLPMLEESFGSDVRSAIHRSSVILGEVQEWLKSQAADWLDQHVLVQVADRVEVALRKPIGSDWPVVQQAMVMLWQRQGWPLQAMSHAHWSQLRSLMQSAAIHSSSIELPSRISVRREGDRLFLVKRAAP